MTFMKLKPGPFLLALGLPVASCLGPAATAGQAPIFAGFNLQRGGITAIDTDSAWLSQLRAAIIDAFPAAQFRGVSTLSGPVLADADVLILCSAFSGGGPISPLSASEINALRSFVVSGGSALLFVDAGTPAGWDAVNESLINAFGLDVAGSAGPNSTIDLTATPSLLASGRFGSVASITFTTGGWFDVLGPDAQAAGVYAGTANVAIACIPKGRLALGSGLVAAFGDTTFILDGSFTPSNRTAVMNAIGAAIGGECRADFDASGSITVQDIFAFLAAWFEGDIARANYNGDAFLDTVDIFAFLADWFSRC